MPGLRDLPKGFTLTGNAKQGFRLLVNGILVERFEYRGDLIEWAIEDEEKYRQLARERIAAGWQAELPPGISREDVEAATEWAKGLKVNDEVWLAVAGVTWRVMSVGDGGGAINVYRRTGKHTRTANRVGHEVMTRKHVSGIPLITAWRATILERRRLEQPPRALVELFSGLLGGRPRSTR